MTSKKFLALLDNPAWSALSQQQSTEPRAQRENDKSVGLGWAAWAFRQSLRRLLCYKLVKINADLRLKSWTGTVLVPVPLPAACGRSAASAPRWSGLGVQGNRKAKKRSVELVSW